MCKNMLLRWEPETQCCPVCARLPVSRMLTAHIMVQETSSISWIGDCVGEEQMARSVTLTQCLTPPAVSEYLRFTVLSHKPTFLTFCTYWGPFSDTQSCENILHRLCLFSKAFSHLTFISSLIHLSPFCVCTGF